MEKVQLSPLHFRSYVTNSWIHDYLQWPSNMKNMQLAKLHTPIYSDHKMPTGIANVYKYIKLGKPQLPSNIGLGAYAEDI